MVTYYSSKVIIEHFICISGPMNSILVSWNKKRRIENKMFKLFKLRALNPQIRGGSRGQKDLSYCCKESKMVSQFER